MWVPHKKKFQAFKFGVHVAIGTQILILVRLYDFLLGIVIESGLFAKCSYCMCWDILDKNLYDSRDLTCAANIC